MSDVRKMLEELLNEAIEHRDDIIAAHQLDPHGLLQSGEYNEVYGKEIARFDALITRGQKTLSTLASEEVGEEEIAKIIEPTVYQAMFNGDCITDHNMRQVKNVSQKLVGAILSRLSLRSGVGEEWQPIETLSVPDLDTDVVLWNPYDGVHLLLITTGPAEIEKIKRGKMYTHWRKLVGPLPSTPSDQKKG